MNSPTIEGSWMQVKGIVRETLEMIDREVTEFETRLSKQTNGIDDN